MIQMIALAALIVVGAKALARVLAASFNLVPGLVCWLVAVCVLHVGLATAETVVFNEPFDTVRWSVHNYKNLLKVVPATVDGESCLELKFERKKADTLFGVRSRRFPVKPDSGFRLTLRVRGTHPMEKSSGQNGRGGTYVGWYDADGEPLVEQRHFGFSVTNAWRDVAIEGHVPATAVEAVVDIGGDSPNFLEGETLQLAKASFALLPAASVPRPAVAKPAPLVAALDPSVRPLTNNVATLRDDGMTLVDGRPFFPIGIYSVHRCAANSNLLEAAFRQLKEGGFNLVHTYDWKRTAEYAEYLDLADKYGMKVFNNPAIPYPKNVIDERTHPCLLAWYLADDASRHTTPEKLRRRSLDLLRYDNAHLTCQADSLGNEYKTRYADFIGSTDVFLPEIYTALSTTVTGREVVSVGHQVQSVFRELAEAGVTKGVWPILQQFADGEGWKRFPTRTELRAMAYLAVVRGAHGIVWYTYAGSRPGSALKGAAEFPERWADLTSVTKELAVLQDDLASRSAARSPKVEILEGPPRDVYDRKSVCCLLKRGVKGPLLIAVNTAPEGVKARIRIRGLKSVRTLFEKDRAPALSADGFVDAFAPNEVHVYRLASGGGSQ